MGDEQDVTRRGMSRRSFLQAAAVGSALVGTAGAMGWTPAFRVPVAGAATIPSPPGFPSSISLYQQAYQNWSGEIAIQNVWTAAPATSADVVTIANWAHANGWRVRPKGKGHGWSPLILPEGNPGADYLLVDTTQHLTNLSIQTTGTPATVTAQTGVTMDTLLSSLGAKGLGLTANPAPGDLTLGGVLAIGGHGSAIKGSGETALSGKTYGSVSNLVLSLTAVVWNASIGQYQLRTFSRSDPGIKPLLVHVGRAFITDVTLQAGADVNLQCVSSWTVPQSTLFAAPASAGSQSFQSLVLNAGRVEVISFPFTTLPWLKVWSIHQSQPWFSNKVSGPYNYGFANTVSSGESAFIASLLKGDASGTPAFENAEMAAVGTGLIFENTGNIWGPSRYSTLYVKPTTLQVTANGYAILTNTNNIQRVVYEFYTYYSNLVNQYAANGQYPMNGPTEFRVTGLDQTSDVVMSGAQQAQLSAIRPRPDQPSWNCAVWIDALTIPGTPHADEFYTQLEAWILSNYTGSYAGVRFEWSKGWGYTNSAAWSSATALGTTVPSMYTAGQASGDGWSSALSTLDSYDPNRIFANPLHDQLMP
ncbi:MAG TPA: cholesterol oxidase substrate-binding domain-containing protein [Acidimicrobiales bacterium]